MPYNRIIKTRFKSFYTLKLDPDSIQGMKWKFMEGSNVFTPIHIKVLSNRTRRTFAIIPTKICLN